MGGLTRLFMRILPIITLICFICFGISYTFETQQTGSLTYLSKEVITLNDNETPQDTTDDLTIEQYKFDMVSYAQNIDQDILKRSTTKVFQLQTYQAVLDTFNNIWEDGYNSGDIMNTILNASILIIDTLILPINIVLVPLRITAGILLTAFSLVGINVNKQTTIINALNFLVDKLNINLSNPVYDKPYSKYNGTWWQMDTTITSQQQGTQAQWSINVLFESQSGGQYKAILVQTINSKLHIWYRDTENYEIEVYNEDNGWIYQDSKTIYIKTNNTLDQADYQKLELYLTNWATQIQ